MKKHMIWSNYNLNLDDWREDLIEDFEYNGIPKDEISEDMLMERMYELNNLYLDDERANLNIQLNNPIIVIADLGAWNGRYSGYKEIESGKISDCLYSDTDYASWYVDGKGDMKCDAVHHDGTNHYLYREWKDNISDTQKDNFKEKIYDGTFTQKDINRYTKSIGNEIAKVYGWKLSEPSKQAKEKPKKTDIER